MVKAKKNISQNQIQHLVYALITVFITVHAFVFYSLYVIEGDSLMLATGTTSVWRALDSQGGVYMFGDYLPVWLMIIIEIAFAFVLAVTMGSPLAFRLVSRKFDPRRNPMIFESAIITATVCLMCPSMSLLANLFYYPYHKDSMSSTSCAVGSV